MFLAPIFDPISFFLPVIVKSYFDGFKLGKALRIAYDEALRLALDKALGNTRNHPFFPWAIAVMWKQDPLHPKKTPCWASNEENLQCHVLDLPDYGLA